MIIEKVFKNYESKKDLKKRLDRTTQRLFDLEIRYDNKNFEYLEKYRNEKRAKEEAIVDYSNLDVKYQNLKDRHLKQCSANGGLTKEINKLNGTINSLKLALDDREKLIEELNKKIADFTSDHYVKVETKTINRKRKTQVMSMIKSGARTSRIMKEVQE